MIWQVLAKRVLPEPVLSSADQWLSSWVKIWT